MKITVEEIVTKEYVLRLTEQEMLVVSALCGSVLGSETHSPRREASRVFDAIVKVVPYEKRCKVIGLMEQGTASAIRFNDYPAED